MSKSRFFCTRLLMAGLFLLLQWLVLPAAVAVPAQPAAAPGAERRVVGLPELRRAFTATEEFLRSDDIEGMEESFKWLQKTQHMAGLVNNESYSFRFLEIADAQERSGRTLRARRLRSMACDLSPHSSWVQLSCLSQVLATQGPGASMSTLWRILVNAGAAPDLLVGLAKDTLVAISFSLALGLYCAFGLLFSWNFATLARRIGRMLPLAIRGPGVPLILALLCCAPACMGLVPALLLWALAGTLLLPECRFLGILTGVVLCAWACSYPVTNRMQSWWEELSPSSLIPVVEVRGLDWDARTHSRLDKSTKISGLAAYGGALRSALEGELERATELLTVAREGGLAESWVMRLEAQVSYRKGDYKTAAEIYERLAVKEPGRAVDLYNRSQIASALLELDKSRLFLKEAYAKDSSLVEFEGGEVPEHIVGSRDVGLLLEPLPLMTLYYAVKPALQHELDVNSVLPERFFFGSTPISILYLGSFLICFCVLFPGVQTATFHVFFVGYTPGILVRALHIVIPGMNWIREQKIGRAVFWQLILMGVQFVLWAPDEQLVLSTLLQPVASFYGGAILGLFLLFSGISILRRRHLCELE